MSILPVQPNFDDGFTPENDIFGRKKLYEQIKNIVSMSSNESIVLGLDDDWGNGKTSFVKMVVGEIVKNESDNINVIYFDAFKNDYQSEPLLAMLASIYSMIDIKTKDASFKEDFLKVSKAVALSMLKHTPKAVIGLLTAKVLDETCDTVKDTVTDVLSDPLEKFIEEKIESANKEITEIENFKNVLESIYTTTGKKTLFIIDELDRAKPDFSLGIIEKVKHLFDAKGFCFLLVMNKSQFEKTIKLTYGDIDTSIYLNKFFHIWFKLPILKPTEVFTEYGYKSESKLLNIFERYIGSYVENDSITTSLSYLLVKSDFSLREAERCIALLRLCYEKDIVENKYLSESLAISLLVFLRVKNYELLVNFLHKNNTQKNIIELINFGADDDIMIDNIIALISYHYLDNIAIFKLLNPSVNSESYGQSLEQVHYELKEMFISPNELRRFTYNGWKVNIFEKLYEQMENIEIS
ncbi:KAP family P-loop NTPase fold protein [Providencia alcalifaciens]|uniref:KAP family P-loop NTPase fold protein n=1 Tax=Providencia alcalifaciens TaxID=126385 RepID=UPI0032DB7E4F